MSNFQTIMSVIATTTALSACSPPSIHIEGNMGDPSKVEILFESESSYAKCAANILDAKGYSKFTHYHPTLKVPIADCRLATIRDTLKGYDGFTDMSTKVSGILDDLNKSK